MRKHPFPAEAFKKVLREGVRAELRTRRAKRFVQLGASAEVRHGADGAGCVPLVVPGLSALKDAEFVTFSKGCLPL